MRRKQLPDCFPVNTNRVDLGGYVMKKVVLLLLVSLGLVALSACDEDESEAVDNDGIEEEVDPADEGPTTDNPDLIEDAGTDDPLEFIEQQGDLLLQDGANEYELKNIYKSDDTDGEGFTRYEDDDFEMRYAIVEVENVADGIEDQGNENLQIIGEIINDTDDDYFFDENMSIKTDEKEESDLSFGLNGAGAADQKSKFIDGFDLEYDIPDNFTLTLYDPSEQEMWDDKFEEEYMDEHGELPEDAQDEFDDFMEEHTVIDKEFTKE